LTRQVTIFTHLHQKVSGTERVTFSAIPILFSVLEDLNQKHLSEFPSIKFSRDDLQSFNRPCSDCHWPQLERWECENAMRSDKRLCTLTPAPAIVIETLVDDWAMDAGRRTQDAGRVR
jgi:hypothetical protein